MTFLRAWVLLFALIPLAWVAYEWHRNTRRLAMGQIAADFMSQERSLDAAAARLDKALARVARA